MARTAGRLLVVTAAAGGAYYLVPFDHPFRRNARTAMAVSQIGLDYKILKWRDKMEDVIALDAAHARNARRLFRLCADQGGVFTKFGQHVSTVGRTIPPAFKAELSRLKDQANYDEWSEIEETFQREFQRPVSDIFSDFDPVPVASASLAQVHRATLLDCGTQVAVKVQHRRVADSIRSDLRSLRVLTGLVIPTFFDGLDLEWIIDEFEKNLTMELDFQIEAQSAMRATKAFEGNEVVKIPAVYPDYTTKQVLTMEFVDGVKLDELHMIPHVHPERVARALDRAFDQMIFVDGFVHGDPHTGNILVTESTSSPAGFELVLLDHGLYRELNEDFRLSYCLFWMSLSTGNFSGVQKAVEGMGVHGATDLFTKIVATPPKSAPGAGHPATDNAVSSDAAPRDPGPEDAETEEEETDVSADADAQQPEPGKPRPKMTAKEAAKFIEDLPRDLLLVMRVNNVLKSIRQSLGLETGTMARSARFAVSGIHRDDPWQLQMWLDRIQLEVGLIAMRLVTSRYRAHARAGQDEQQVPSGARAERLTPPP